MKTTQAHTPGPWSELDGFIVGRFAFNGEVHDICDPRCIPADVPGAMAEMEANARLIAAAPALLEALESLTECFTAYVDVENTINADIADAWNGAKSALSIARGNAPESDNARLAKAIYGEGSAEHQAMLNAPEVDPRDAEVKRLREALKLSAEMLEETAEDSDEMGYPTRADNAREAARQARLALSESGVAK